MNKDPHHVQRKPTKNEDGKCASARPLKPNTELARRILGGSHDAPFQDESRAGTSLSISEFKMKSTGNGTRESWASPWNLKPREEFSFEPPTLIHFVSWTKYSRTKKLTYFSQKILLVRIKDSRAIMMCKSVHITAWHINVDRKAEYLALRIF